MLSNYIRVDKGNNIYYYRYPIPCEDDFMMEKCHTLPSVSGILSNKDISKKIVNLAIDKRNKGEHNDMSGKSIVKKINNDDVYLDYKDVKNI